MCPACVANPKPTKPSVVPTVGVDQEGLEPPVREEQEVRVELSSQASVNVSVEVLREIKLIRHMYVFRIDIQALRDDLGVVRSVVEGISGRIDAMESRIQSLEAKCFELEAAKPDGGRCSPPSRSCIMLAVTMWRSRKYRRSRLRT